jgi:dehydrogenase/reductase SDR family member 1
MGILLNLVIGVTCFSLSMGFIQSISLRNSMGIIKCNCNSPSSYVPPQSTSIDHNKLLEGKVACVTGASRGIGRGIAIALAEMGASVYITGRSLNSDFITESQLGGSLDSLNNVISSFGGKSIAVQVDHRDDKSVETLFERIEKEQGRLDILVNNAFQLPKPLDGEDDEELLFKDFWEQPGWFWDSLANVGLRSHYMSSVLAYPLLRRTAQSCSNEHTSMPTIVHISSFGGATYSFNVAYGVAKAAVDRMAKDMAIELRKEGIRCISLYPGIVRTERMSTLLSSGEFETRTGLATPSRFVESPYLSGEVIGALYAANDGYLDRISGQVAVSAELAKRYGIKDRISKLTPPSIRSLKYLIPALVLSKRSREERKWLEDIICTLSPDILLPMSAMGSSPPPRL